MAETRGFLPGARERARWMRLDTAQILKRFFFCERSLLVSIAAWVPSIPSLEIKTELPYSLWQNALTADSLRTRVFELRYPSRLMEEGSDTSLIDLCDHIRNAPSQVAFLHVLGTVMLPALRDAYRDYLELSDPLADGPTHRFLSLALQEKEHQVGLIRRWARVEMEEHPALREEAQSWTQAIACRLDMLGGIGIEPAGSGADAAPLPDKRSYCVPDKPARDSRFFACRFYWPDIVDPTFSYGEGVNLQLRSAVSHLNEVWAVETAATILSAFADELPWDWIRDAARWLYDEARHCRMGYDRLLAWGFTPSELPLGNYISESMAGQDAIYRLGMLFFFETKNIKNKPKRADLFRAYGDAVSEHDMDFDWADETIHAGYGKHWMMQLLQARGQDPGAYAEIRDRCRTLVDDCLQTATAAEVRAIKEVAAHLTAKAASQGERALQNGHRETHPAAIRESVS